MKSLQTIQDEASKEGGKVMKIRRTGKRRDKEKKPKPRTKTETKTETKTSRRWRRDRSLPK